MNSWNQELVSIKNNKAINVKMANDWCRETRPKNLNEIFELIEERVTSASKFLELLVNKIIL